MALNLPLLPMKSTLATLLAASVLWCQPGPTLAPGDYLGVLQIGAAQLRLALHVTKSAEGVFNATLDSLDQGATGLATKITVEGKTVRLGTSAGVNYEGVLNPQATEIAGTFKQGTVDAPLTFKKVDKIETAKRPQNPVRPFPYTETEVAVTNNTVQLGGTLTTPKGDGPFPAVILLTGSGPQDRDESLFDHKPFLVLSDHLTRRGFAVLRLDDRGIGKSTGSLMMSSFDDLASDALAALTFLKTRKEVDPKKIGLLGHSEGAAIAQLAASRNPEVAFLISIAGPGVAGSDLLYEQGQLIGKAMGASSDALMRQRRVQQAFIEPIKTETDNKALTDKLRAEIARFKAELPPAELAAAGANLDKQLESEIRRSLLPPFQSLIRHDPAPLFKKITCPVLALNGTLDLQVAHYQNLPAIASALASTQHPDYTIAALPRLNHLLQTAKTGTLQEYIQIEETIAPRALQTIADWLTQRFLAQPAR